MSPAEAARTRSCDAHSAADFQADGALGTARADRYGAPGGSDRVRPRSRRTGLTSAPADEIARPGFINLTLADECARAAAGRRWPPTRASGVPLADAPETVVVDYSAPERRQGDARRPPALDDHRRRARRLLDFARPHGDPRRTTSATGARRSACSSSTCSTWRGRGRPRAVASAISTRFYRQARAKFDADDAFAGARPPRVVLLPVRRPATRSRLWQLLVDESQALLRRASTTGSGVLLTDDDSRRELLQPRCSPTSSTSSTTLGCCTSSDGALCVFPPGFTNREGEPAAADRAASATAATATRPPTWPPSATASRRCDATRLLYVVGAPQAQHFADGVRRRARCGLAAPAGAGRARRLRLVLGTDGRCSGRAPATSSAGRPARRGRRARAGRWSPSKNPDLDAADAGRGRARGRHRRGQVRRPLERPHQGLRLRLGPDAGLRRQHRAVPAVRARADPLDLPARLEARATCHRARSRPSARWRSTCWASPRSDQVAESLEPIAGRLPLQSGRGVHRLLRALPGPQARGGAPSSRLALCDLTARVLARGLDLLGIAARPDVGTAQVHELTVLARAERFSTG